MNFEPFNRHLLVLPVEEKEDTDIHRIVLPDDYNIPQSPYVICDVLDRASSCDIELFKKFYNAMLNKGVYLAPSAYEAGFLSIAHTEEDINRTIEAASAVFSSL